MGSAKKLAISRVIGVVTAIFVTVGSIAVPVGAQPLQAEADVQRRLPESHGQVLLSYAPLVKDVAPAVVNIYTRQVVQVQRSPLFSDSLFRRFFGEDNPFSVPQERVRGSLGSGVIVGGDGIIVTNNHVVGGADQIRVVLSDRREFEAQILMADERTDLAVLKIDTGGEILPALALADSDAIEVGDIVVAIGNPLGLGQTVTSGIVSATARSQVGASHYQYFIQTDAAINPGNSGGALVGLDGKLAGINSMIISQSGGSQGIGFAIPSNMVRAVISAALDEGEIVRPWLGASGQAVSMDVAASLGLERPGGVLVDNIYPGSPAEDAGLIPGDVILAVDGKEVIDTQGLRFRVATAPNEDEVSLDIYRNGEHFEVPVALIPPPDDPPRDTTPLTGRHPFQGVTVANLNPRFAEELGIDPMQRGVIILEIDRRAPAWRRQFVRPGDIFLALGETRITDVGDLVLALEETEGDYLYRLSRRGRVIECGIIASRSFYCR